MSAGRFAVGGAVVAMCAIALVPLFKADIGALAKSGHSSPTAQAASSLSSNTSNVVGVSGGEHITRSDLSSGQSAKIYEAEKNLWDTYESILLERRMDAYFASEAKKRGLDLEAARKAWISEKANVTDAQVQMLIEQNKDNPALQQIPADQRVERIRDYLVGQSSKRVMSELMSQFRGEVQVAMAAPVEPTYNVESKGFPLIGSPNAKVTIIEFADYQCPFCSKMIPALQNVLKKYDGKVNWVFRDFPLESIHPEAFPASTLALCAGKQGKYWEMHNFLFENSANLGKETYEKGVKSVGLDAAKIEECTKDPATEAAIRANINAGSDLGINGTPAYFINGRKLGGAVPQSELERVIESELARK